LEGKLVEPLSPKGSGFEPILTNDFFGVGRGRGIRTQVSPRARPKRDYTMRSGRRISRSDE
jgi:hypothetical protein